MTQAIRDRTNVSTSDEVKEQLLNELKRSPTDLAKLVMRVVSRRRIVVPISAAAVARWNKEDPDSWARVSEWLTTRGVKSVIVA